MSKIRRLGRLRPGVWSLRGRWAIMSGRTCLVKKLFFRFRQPLAASAVAPLTGWPRGGEDSDPYCKRKRLFLFPLRDVVSTLEKLG